MVKMRVLALGFSILWITGCNPIEVPAPYKSNLPRLDGDLNDWETTPVVLREHSITVSAQHNDEYVLMLLQSFSPQHLILALGSGFTVWFDGEGGNKRQFGLRFPGRTGLGDIPAQRNGPPDPLQLRTAFQEHLQTTSSIELVNDKGIVIQRFPRDIADGALLAPGMVDDRLICEIRIPLSGIPGFPLPLDRGEKLGVGLNLEPPNRGENREQMKGMGGPGGMGKRNGMGGHGKGVPPGGQKRPQLEKVEIWMTVLIGN